MKGQSSRSAIAIPIGPVDEALAQFLSEHADTLPLGLASDGSTSNSIRVGVAYSGGADSTALLLATYKRWPQQTYALHIHHGLQDAAEDFLKHCEKQCKTLNIPLVTQRINAQPALGESPEDAARNGRYAALIAMAQELHLDVIFLGQHADDQVETLLIALSRGAGLPGLACMPYTFKKEGVLFARPMLEVNAPALKTWLRTHSLAWIEDPTNQDKSYTRNKVRLEILPHIAKNFPSYQSTYLRSIQHIVQAQSLLEELAQQDLESIGTPPNIVALQGLSLSRQTNSLRYWLKKKHQTAASAKQLKELLKQILACTTRGHQIHVRIGHGYINRSGACIVYSKK